MHDNKTEKCLEMRNDEQYADKVLFTCRMQFSVLQLTTCIIMTIIETFLHSDPFHVVT